MMGKFYIGDGVYLETDGFDIKLTTEDGVSVSNTIFLNLDMINLILKKVKGE